MSSSKLFAAVVLGLLADLGSANIRPNHATTVVRLGPGVTVGTHDFEQTVQGLAEIDGPYSTTTSIEADPSPGVLFGVGWRFGAVFGLDIGLQYSVLSLSWSSVGETQFDDLAPLRGTDRLDFVPVTLGVNVHLLADHPVDLWVGPRGGFLVVREQDHGIQLYADELGTIFTEHAAIEEGIQPTYGVQAGLDVPFGGAGWCLDITMDWMKARVKYTLDEADFDRLERDGVAIDPLTVRIGMAYRW